MKPKPNQPKPEAHLYRADYPTKEAWLEARFQWLDGLQAVCERVLLKMKLRSVFWDGEVRVILSKPFPLHPDYKKPEHLPPNHHPLIVKSHKSEFVWEPTGQTFTVRQFLECMLGAENLEPFLRKLSISDLPLTRLYVYESGDERSIGTHPVTALAELHRRDGEAIRGCIIETPSLDIALELVEQEPETLPWGTVPLRADGTLADIRWHGAYLTNLERLLVEDQELRDLREARQRRERALNNFLTENQ
jgi:hypothetical protein